MHLAPRYIYCYKRSWGASGLLLSGNCSWLHSCICISILSKLAQSFRCFDVSTPCFMWCRSQKCAMWSVWWKFHRFKSKRPWFYTNFQVGDSVSSMEISMTSSHEQQLMGKKPAWIQRPSPRQPKTPGGTYGAALGGSRSDPWSAEIGGTSRKDPNIW